MADVRIHSYVPLTPSELLYISELAKAFPSDRTFNVDVTREILRIRAGTIFAAFIEVLRSSINTARHPVDVAADDVYRLRIEIQTKVDGG